MYTEKLITLLVKKRLGTATLAEQAELAELLKGTDDSAFLSDSFNEIYDSNIEYDVSQKEINAALNNIKEKISKKEIQKTSQVSKLSGMWPKIIVAASVSSLLLVSILFFNNSYKNPHSTERNIVTTKKGSRSNIVLPDGTKVSINADTKLSYDKTFGEDIREVTLEGEAYFDVVKNTALPFIVHTKSLDIKVLGTAFNVRAYNDEVKTQTTLLHGVVEVFLKEKNDQKIILKPNEKVIVQNDYAQNINNQAQKSFEKEPAISLVKITPSPIDSAIVETQWLTNKLSFDQEKLEDILPVLERWYGVDIASTNTDVLQRRFSGVFENETIGEVLQTLKYSMGINYKTENKKIIIF